MPFYKKNPAKKLEQKINNGKKEYQPYNSNFETKLQTLLKEKSKKK